MKRSRWIPIGCLVLSLASLDAAAQDLEIRQKPLTRRFPLSYCPFETRDVDPAQGAFGLFFTPPGTEVTIHFSVSNQDSSGNWGDHRIDNITVQTRTDFEANRGVPPGYGSCYVDPLPGFPNTGEDAPAFFFNRFGPGALPFVELFDTDPTGDPARPWDLSQFAYYLAEGESTTCDQLSPKPSSAPRNPELGTDCTLGALQLGRETDGDVIARTSIRVTGLVAGVEYIVTGWWDTEDFSLENPLTVRITAPAADGARTLIALDDLSQSQGVDRLVRIPNLSTGVGALVGSLGDNFRDAEAMAVLPGTTGADRIFVVDDARLLELDPATGAGTLIGPIGFDDVDGIAFHPTTGVLYGVTHGSNLLIRINTTTGAGTLVADDVVVGSRLVDIAFHPDGRAFLLTGGTPRVRRIDLATGVLLQTWTLSGGSSLESLLFSPDGSTLYSAADRGTTKDLVTIDLATSTITFVSQQSSGFRDIEALAWVSAQVDQALLQWSGVTDAPLPRNALRLRAVPNPFNPTTRIHYELPEASPVRLDILDVAGRSIRTLAVGPRPSGPGSQLWDGRDAAGQPVASGIYVARLVAGAERATARLVLVR